MAITLTCPSCERALRVKDELAGRKIKCPQCGGVIAVIAKETDGAARITAKKPPPAHIAEEDTEPEEEERPRKKKKKKGKSNQGLIIGAAVGGVAIVAVVIFLLTRDTAPKKIVQNRPAPVEPQPVVKPLEEPPPTEEPVIEKKAPAGAAARIREVTEVQNVLRQLGVAYRNFEVAENRGPKNQQELGPYYENNGQINEYLKNKWVTFIWEARRQSFDEHGASNTVLAYETDPDARGIRMVLYGDGSVHGLEDAEFQKSPKAKGK